MEKTWYILPKRDLDWNGWHRSITTYEKYSNTELFSLLELVWRQICSRVCAKSLQSCLTLCNPMDHSCRALQFMGFSRQEYWRGLSFPFPGDPPNPGIKPVSLMSPALPGRFFTTSATYSRDLDVTLDCSPPGSFILEILQARLLEWVAVPSSRGSSQPGMEPEFPMSLALAGGFSIQAPNFYV